MNVTDTILEESAPQVAEDLNAAETIDQQQTRRLEEYLNQELSNPDAQQAVLATRIAQNLEITHRLGREFLDAAAETGSLADVIADQPEAVAAMFQSQRQAERFLKVAADCKRARDSNK